MGSRIKMTLELPLQLKKKEKWVVASCPVLDIASQGATEDEARRNLAEALHVFLESCIDRGTLDQVLKECGFEAVAQDAETETGSAPESISIPLYLLSKFDEGRNCHHG